MTQVSRKGFVDKNGQKVVIVPNVHGATEGNLPQFDAEGNLQDSGKKPADFAPADLIKGKGTGAYAEDSAAVVAGANTIDVEIEKSGVLYNAEINTTNFANLQRALEDPAAPASGEDKLITNGQVYDALANKKSLEDGEGDYASIVRIGKINHGDDELDAADIFGHDAIRIRVNGGTVYIDGNNINNLQRALEGPDMRYDGELVIMKAVESSTEYPVRDRSEITQALNRFVQQCKDGVYYVTDVHIKYSGASLVTLAGLAKWTWHRGSGGDDLSVLITIGDVCFSVYGNAPSLDSITWGEYYDKNNYAQSF